VHKCLIMAGAAALALLFAGSTARAQQANLTLPKEPTMQSGSTYYYAVPIGYTWDNMTYVPNPNDWNVGDHGFDAGEIPGNPTFCGAKGDMCTADAGGPKSTSFITVNNDPTHGFTNIPLLIGPTQDGFNNVQIADGQSIPVVPGHYTALYVTNTQVNGPRTKMLVLNYADSAVVHSLKWADWCAPSQAAPDIFTWSPTHRLSTGGGDGATCALITKYVAVDPNRVLTSVTLGTDTPDNGGGISLPGDTITGTNGRTMIGGITLASADATLGGYGFVSGHVLDSTGKVQTSPTHDGTGGAGYDVFVLSPSLGNYGAGANVDGSYTIGLPAGTYTLSAAVRDGSGPGAGPQATPVTVTVTAGQTTKQDITLLAKADPTLWGELKGTVKDASGNPVTGAAILISESMTGPFAARGIPDANGEPQDGTTQSDGTYDIQGIDATKPIFVGAAGNGFASASATMVTLKGGSATTQDITVAPVAEGNITGTVMTPDSQFGGIGVPVTLSGKNLTLTTTTLAIPPLAGTAVVPETGETATFQFTGIPAGDYMLTLPASAVQGAAASTPVTIKAGQTANPILTIAFPAWSEGTADPKISDALTGTALDAKWTAADIGTPGAKGSVTAASSGLTVNADGTGWDNSGAGNDDAFYYVYQSIPVGDWVAYATVSAGTSSGVAGLMVASSTKAAPLMANFTATLTSGAGIASQGRQADGTNTFDFGETVASTDPSNGGTAPALPIVLKMRKVGGNFASFYSADGGKTQHFIANLAPQFDPTASLLLGLATTSSTDGTLDKATYQNFVFAPLAAPAPAAGQ
jgi:carboxypeptidase family protein